MATPIEGYCPMCGGALSAEQTQKEVETDIPMGEDECSFTPQENDSTTCEVDGWGLWEHIEGSYWVHGSCYLDHDDQVSLVA